MMESIEANDDGTSVSAIFDSYKGADDEEQSRKSRSMNIKGGSKDIDCNDFRVLCIFGTQLPRNTHQLESCQHD